MNKEKVLQVVAAIRASDASTAKMKFDMSIYGMKNCRPNDRSSDCEAAGCSAGFAAALFQSERWRDFLSLGSSVSQMHELHPYRIAKDELELTELEAERLFNPRNAANYLGYRVRLASITPQIAADVLESFANTGEIEWPPKTVIDPYCYCD